MRLAHFDQLKYTVEQVVEKYRNLRFRCARLEEENKKLQERLAQFEELPSSLDGQKLKSILMENRQLKTRRSEVKKRLQHLIAELEKKK